ncbi:MAG: hypothetical protein K2O65_10540 [Lachnospiraceae bacterium]|nr:hypothetical protein [Lachnospiraceae bacterium]
MSLQINNYQPFYVGTEPLTMTGHGEESNFHKDTLVKYEFNTTDQSGNKVMDKLSRAETMELMNSVSRQYGDNVLVQFSGDALDILQSDIKGQYSMLNDEAIKQMEEKAAKLAEFVKPAQELWLRIPNIRTDVKFQESLKGMDNNIAQAAFSIIKTDLLPHDIGNMTEQQRQDLISFGMEKARYLAEKMGDKGALFLEAMEEVAKYGMSGKADSSGKVTYDIQWGPPPGWPDDHVSTSELMQEISPEKWKTYQDMCRQAERTGDSELNMKASRYFWDWEKWVYQYRRKEVNEIKSRYTAWQKELSKITVKKFDNIDRTDTDSLLNSVIGQNTALDSDFLQKNMDRFVAVLSKDCEE